MLLDGSEYSSSHLGHFTSGQKVHAWYPLDNRSVDGSQSHSGCFTEDRNFFLLLGIEHSSHSPAHGIVTVVTEHSQFGDLVLIKLPLAKLKEVHYVSGAGVVSIMTRLWAG